MSEVNLIKEIEYWLRVIGDRQGADRRFSDTARDVITAITEAKTAADPGAEQRAHLHDIERCPPAMTASAEPVATDMLAWANRDLDGYMAHANAMLEKAGVPARFRRIDKTEMALATAARATPPSDAARVALSVLCDAVMAHIKEAKKRLDADIEKDAPVHPVSAFLIGLAIDVGKARAALSAAPVSAARGIDIRLEQGNAGLWYVTSVAIPGLLVTGATHQEAIAGIGWALLEMQDARAALDRNERALQPYPPSKVTAVASRSLVDAITQRDLKALMACTDINAARACLRRIVKKAIENGVGKE